MESHEYSCPEGTQHIEEVVFSRPLDVIALSSIHGLFLPDLFVSVESQHLYYIFLSSYTCYPTTLSFKFNNFNFYYLIYLSP